MTQSPSCAWAASSPAMARYHDTEWGRPSREDRHLFEMLVLESAQAGLSWSTILNKREGYRNAFDGFDPRKVARYGDEKVAALLADPGIIRNRQKIVAAVRNAAAFLRLAESEGTFAGYLWAWVQGEPIMNCPRTPEEVPATSALSDSLSKDLKRRGFSFVGPTIVYSYLQAVGVVNDHLAACPARTSSAKVAAK